jgi:SNF2 family DNA or RNA helicase
VRGIGQKRAAQVFKLITEGTLEEKISVHRRSEASPRGFG